MRRKQSATIDLKVRMKEPLRAALERAAKRRGVSMNTEAVARLEQSFRDAEQVAHFQETFYGARLARCLDRLGRAVHAAGTYAGHHSVSYADGKATDWMDDPYAYDQAIMAAIAVLEESRPSGDIVIPAVRGAKGPPGEDQATTDRRLGLMSANLGKLFGWSAAEDGQPALRAKDIQRLNKESDHE